MRELLVDVDVLVYEAAFSAQRTLYKWQGRVYQNAAEWKADVEKRKLNVKEEREKRESYIEVLPENVAEQSADKKLKDIIEAAGGGKSTLIMSGDHNYREEYAVTKKYKGNRDAVEKPRHYQHIRSYYIEKHGCEVTSGIEADDAIGIEITRNAEAVVCSIDKDLNQLPGRHYDWNKKLRYMVDKINGHRWFWTQMLTGDSTDNIPGLPGYGDKCAEVEKLREAKTVGGQVKIVLDAYQKEGQSMKYLNEQGVLLWMQRKPGQIWTLEDYMKEYA